MLFKPLACGTVFCGSPRKPAQGVRAGGFDPERIIRRPRDNGRCVPSAHTMRRAGFLKLPVTPGIVEAPCEKDLGEREGAEG